MFKRLIFVFLVFLVSAPIFADDYPVVLGLKFGSTVEQVEERFKEYSIKEVNRCIPAYNKEEIRITYENNVIPLKDSTSIELIFFKNKLYAISLNFYAVLSRFDELKNNIISKYGKPQKLVKSNNGSKLEAEWENNLLGVYLSSATIYDGKHCLMYLLYVYKPIDKMRFKYIDNIKQKEQTQEKEKL